MTQINRIARFCLPQVMLTICLLASPPVQAQTGQTPNLLPPSSGITNVSQLPTAQSFFVQAVSLHRPDVNYYAATNEIDLQFGAAWHSTDGKIEQSTEIDYYRLLADGNAVGFGVGFDSLGVAGQNLDSVEACGYYRINWNNVAANGGIGLIRDIADNAWGAEAILGGEIRLSPNAGIFARYSLGWENLPNTAANQKMFSGIEAGMSIALGK